MTIKQTNLIVDEREDLNLIGIALSSTSDVAVLLDMILAKMREITSADAGSLYVVAESGSINGLSGHAEKSLRFKLVQNDSRQFPYVEQSLPISEDSMAGYSALHGEVVVLDDVYRIPADRPYRFNPSYDLKTAYRTRSLLTVPMKNPRGEVLGVMQLLNRKKNRDAQLCTLSDVDAEVEPFPWGAVRLAESLASQAAIAYENSQLYENISTLFEGFVQAAVSAIEQRDPTTSGHSLRVAEMTVQLAAAVNSAAEGPYANVHFTPAQMKELRYAALLHDFGKIAVREDVLVKAKRLYPTQLAMIEQRFEYLHQQIETERAQNKMSKALSHEPCGAKEFGLIDVEYDARTIELENWLRFVIDLNESTQLPRDAYRKLIHIASQTYQDRFGVKHRVLTTGEVASLSVEEGSLNEDEREEIQSHVTHSFHFLNQIPWTPELKYIPWIVRAHHEKTNGTGYPLGLRGEEIPLQAKIMIICDVFDALCAADRPYRRAIPLSQALAILEAAVSKDELDAELFRIFLRARIFDLVPQSSD